MIIRLILVLALILLNTNNAYAGQKDIGAHKQLPTIINYPGGSAKAPGVLVLHTSAGLKKTVKEYGEALTGKGFVTYVPDFFSPYGLKPKTRRETWTTYHDNLRDDFLAIIDEMKNDSAVDANRIFVVGFSNGGYWAALLAAEGEVAGGVSYYGALSSGGTDTNQDRLGMAFSEESNPLLILHGSEDEVVAVHHAELTKNLAEEAGAPVELHIFENAHHSYNVTKALKKSSANKAATDKSWELTLNFLK